MVRTNDPKAPPLGSRLLAFCRASPLSRLGSRLRRVAGLGIVRMVFWFAWRLWPSTAVSEGLVVTVLVSSGVGREADVGGQGLQTA